jgi:hypothetical protein
MENIPTTKPSKKTTTKASVKPSTEPSSEPTKQPATVKKSALRKLSDQEKTDIKKHITKNNLDMSAARKLRFAQMRTAEGSSVKSTVKKIAKTTASK